VLVEVIAQRFRSGGVTQLGHRLGFDLADALAGNAVDLADLIKRVWLAVGESESQSDDAGFAVGQRGEHGLQLVSHQREGHRLERHHGLGVFDDVAEVRIAFLADGLI
jgi:hypothetical protein